MDVIVDRVAGLDVHKKVVVATVRVPGDRGRERAQFTRSFRTFTDELLRMRDWLSGQGVAVIAMEATGVFWLPVWYALTDERLDTESGELTGELTTPDWQVLVVNALHLKRAPGRKTDVKDAEWIAQCAECGLLRSSFVPPQDVRELRDLTRYRCKLIQEHTREVLRLQKVLEDAQIKLSAVVADTTGVSSKKMLRALCAGERDPEALADLAYGRMRSKKPVLSRALLGRFNDHHAFMVGMLLDHLDELDRHIDRLDAEVDRLMVPFAEVRDLLDTIPGVGRRTAEVIIAETGADMTQFPTDAALASWAGMCPGQHQSAGKRRSGKTRHGNVYLRTALVEAAWAASRTKDTYLQAKFRRIARGKQHKKACVAVGHAILIAAWHIMAEHRPYQDLGGDFYTRRIDKQAHAQRLVHQLEALGLTVTITEQDPAA